MKRSTFVSTLFLGTGSLDLAWSFAPIANSQSKPYNHLCPAGTLKKNVISRRNNEFLQIHSSSPTEDMESISAKEIVGPELPPIKGSAKRLFLVRHGEVINPGKQRGYLKTNIETTPLG